MNKWLIEDGSKTLFEITTIEELEKSLYKIKNELKDKNIIIILVHPEGHLMYIGISKSYGYLNYHDGSEEPPYYSSIGDEDAEGELNFYLNGFLSEIPLKNCIPFELLVNAINEYFKTSELPNIIKWEED